jgi:hypothetical protein
MLALHLDQNQVLLTSEPFLHFLVRALARRTEQGSGGRTPLSSITPMAHNPSPKESLQQKLVLRTDNT